MAATKDVWQMIKASLRHCRSFLQGREDWCTFQELQSFLSTLQLDPSTEPLVQTYLYVPAVSQCIIQGDLVCLVKCYNTAWEKLKKLVASHQQASLTYIETMFQKQTNKAEQISIGSVTYFVGEVEGNLQMKDCSHPCSGNYLPLHLYFIVAALDLMTEEVKTSKKQVCQCDQFVHLLKTTKSYAKKLFSNKVKADEVIKFIKSYSSLLNLTGTSVSVVETCRQPYEVVEEHFNCGVARIESLLKKHPYSLRDLFKIVNNNFPQRESNALGGKDIEELKKSIISQPESFLVTGPKGDVVFLHKDQVGDPLPLLAINNLKGLIEKGMKHRKAKASAAYPLSVLVADCGHLPALEKLSLGVTHKEIRCTLSNHPDQFLVANEAVSLIPDAPSVPKYFLERMQHLPSASNKSLDADEVSASSSMQSMPCSEVSAGSSISNPCSEQQGLYETDIVGDHGDMTSFLQSLKDNSFEERGWSEMPELVDNGLTLQNSSRMDQELGDTGPSGDSDFSGSSHEPCLIKIVQDPVFFQSFIQEKLSMYCRPIVGVAFTAGWLLLHFWEGEALAVDVSALSPIPPFLIQSPTSKVAGGTLDNMSKWSIIYCAKELLSDHTILKVVHRVDTMSVDLAQAGMKIDRVFDVMIADNVIHGCRGASNPLSEIFKPYGIKQDLPSDCCQNKYLRKFAQKYGFSKKIYPECKLQSSLPELLGYYGIHPDSNAQVLNDCRSMSEEMNTGCHQERSLEDAIAKLRDTACFSSRLIPHLYQMMLQMMDSSKMAELNTCTEKALEKLQDDQIGGVLSESNQSHDGQPYSEEGDLADGQMESEKDQAPLSWADIVDQEYSQEHINGEVPLEWTVPVMTVPRPSKDYVQGTAQATGYQKAKVNSTLTGAVKQYKTDPVASKAARRRKRKKEKKDASKEIVQHHLGRVPGGDKKKVEKDKSKAVKSQQTAAPASVQVTSHQKQPQQTPKKPKEVPPKKSVQNKPAKQPGVTKQSVPTNASSTGAKPKAKKDVDAITTSPQTAAPASMQATSHQIQPQQTPKKPNEVPPKKSVQNNPVNQPGVTKQSIPTNPSGTGAKPKAKKSVDAITTNPSAISTSKTSKKKAKAEAQQQLPLSQSKKSQKKAKTEAQQQLLTQQKNLELQKAAMSKKSGKAKNTISGSTNGNDGGITNKKKDIQVQQVYSKEINGKNPQRSEVSQSAKVDKDAGKGTKTFSREISIVSESSVTSSESVASSSTLETSKKKENQSHQAFDEETDRQRPKFSKTAKVAKDVGQHTESFTIESSIESESSLSDYEALSSASETMASAGRWGDGGASRTNWKVKGQTERVEAYPEAGISDHALWMKPMVLQHENEWNPVFIHPLSELACVPTNPCQSSTDELKDQLGADMQKFVEAFSNRIRDALLHLAQESSATSLEQLTEVVMDVGRQPVARYSAANKSQDRNNERCLDDQVLSKENISQFLEGNQITKMTECKATIKDTLHRIGVMVNKQQQAIGITAKVVRPLPGCLNPICDLFNQDRSIVFVGPVGVGKTSLLREAARVLSDVMGKSVLVIDTYCEIAGDCEIPHASIGSARRIQVFQGDKQALVITEAIQNHRPDVVIVDEIETSDEMTAVINLHQQHIQVIASAQGHQTLLDVVGNPTFSPINGGIQNTLVSYFDVWKYKLSSNVAKHRCYAPVFDVLIEMRERNRWVIHKDLGTAIDACLKGETIRAEERKVVDVESLDGIGGQQVVAMEIPVDYTMDSHQY